jgi:hypothetical protein
MMPAGKIFINAISQGGWHRRLFGGVISFILVLNIAFYIVFKIRMSKDIYTAPQAETYRVFVLIIALCSAVMIAFLAVIYLQFKNTNVLVGPKGIAYLSFLRKIRASWDEVREIRILARQQGQVLHVSTAEGSFVLGPQFVEKDKPLPEFRFEKQKLLVIDQKGTASLPDLKKTDIYKTIKGFAPTKIKFIEGAPEPKRKKNRLLAK